MLHGLWKRGLAWVRLDVAARQRECGCISLELEVMIHFCLFAVVAGVRSNYHAGPQSCPPQLWTFAGILSQWCELCELASSGRGPVGVGSMDVATSRTPC